MASMSRLLTPSDALFLYLESRETMMHAAGLLHFTAPADSPPDHLRHVVEELRAAGTVRPPWNLKLATPDFLKNPLQAWIEDDKVDIDYHVRRTALPSPGDERELGIVVSRLHGHSIDLHRPPWEVHLIEGLERGRFALYVKVHHALLDGYTATRVLSQALTPEPRESLRPFFFELPEVRKQRPRPAPETAGELEATGPQFADLIGAVRDQYGAAQGVYRAMREVVRASRSEGSELVTPRSAPPCILNKRIGRSRRFATQQIEVARLKAAARAAGGTINDVILALSGGSLRRYLLEQDALPASPLVAMVPVNARPKDDPGGGNAVGALLASMATDIDDPVRRLAAVIASTTRAKEQLQGMSRLGILEYSALLLTPAGLQLLPVLAGHVRPAFNVVVSNVPGPEGPLYLGGARLESNYPMSIPVHGLALNITCMSYAGRMNFGFIGCRDTLPHLQRLAVYLGEEMVALERALALPAAPPAPELAAPPASKSSSRGRSRRS